MHLVQVITATAMFRRPCSNPCDLDEVDSEHSINGMWVSYFADPKRMDEELGQRSMPNAQRAKQASDVKIKFKTLMYIHFILS